MLLCNIYNSCTYIPTTNTSPCLLQYQTPNICITWQWNKLPYACTECSRSSWIRHCLNQFLDGKETTNSHILLTFAVRCLSPLPSILSHIQHNATHSVNPGSSSPQGHDMRLPTHLCPVPRLSMSSAVTQWPYISSQNARRQINFYLLLIKCYFNSTSDCSPTDRHYHAWTTMATVVQAWDNILQKVPWLR
jgi:hypothetical protein